MTSAVEKVCDVEVRTVAAVEGNYGPQWQLEVQYPFSRYPTKQWLMQESYPAVNPGTYRCTWNAGS